MQSKIIGRTIKLVCFQRSCARSLLAAEKQKSFVCLSADSYMLILEKMFSSEKIMMIKVVLCRMLVAIIARMVNHGVGGQMRCRKLP